MQSPKLVGHAPILLCSIIFLVGCKGQENRDSATATPSWESMAKGYEVEGSKPIFGIGRIIRMTQESAEGNLYDFNLSVGPVPKWSERKSKVTRFWGWDASTSEPERLHAAQHVREMTLSLGGKPVHIPEAAYEDLVELRVGGQGSPLYAQGSRAYLYLEGADAGESYRVKFTIESSRVVKREVWAGEFPEMGAHVMVFEPTDS